MLCCQEILGLLIFTFAGQEDIQPWAADANIVPGIASDRIHTTSAKNTIISTGSVNEVCTGTAEDKVISAGTTDSAHTRDQVCDVDAVALGRFEVIQSDGKSTMIG